ncbi:MAG: hypothetical protein M1831_002345 [Alyxoria varia]|nr:MAG: hypothetical protein M1831_002345 [Alyxoria varia]
MVAIPQADLVSLDLPTYANLEGINCNYDVAHAPLQKYLQPFDIPDYTQPVPVLPGKCNSFFKQADSFSSTNGVLDDKKLPGVRLSLCAPEATDPTLTAEKTAIADALKAIKDTCIPTQPPPGGPDGPVGGTAPVASGKATGLFLMVDVDVAKQPA